MEICGCSSPLRKWHRPTHMVCPWHLRTPLRTKGFTYLLSKTHVRVGPHNPNPGCPEPAVHPQAKMNRASESAFKGTLQVKRENVQNSLAPDQTSNSPYVVHCVWSWKTHLTTLSPSMN